MNKSIQSESQLIQLTNRKKLQITGVNKLESLNSDEFIIQTKLGLLLIQGKDLTMSNLDLEKEEIHLEGSINGLIYLDKEQQTKKTSFFGKLFK